MSSYRPRQGKKNKRVGSLASLADVLPQVCEDLELDKKINELAFLALWPKRVEVVAGALGSQQTRAVRLRKQGFKTTLLVRVSSAALASELGFHLPVLKEALNAFAPQTGIKIDAIQLMVGSV